MTDAHGVSNEGKDTSHPVQRLPEKWWLATLVGILVIDGGVYLSYTVELLSVDIPGLSRTVTVAEFLALRYGVTAFWYPAIIGVIITVVWAPILGLWAYEYISIPPHRLVLPLVESQISLAPRRIELSQVESLRSVLQDHLLREEIPLPKGASRDTKLRAAAFKIHERKPPRRKEEQKGG